jgi:hypothetical protein
MRSGKCDNPLGIGYTRVSNCTKQLSFQVRLGRRALLSTILERPASTAYHITNTSINELRGQATGQWLYYTNVDSTSYNILCSSRVQTKSKAGEEKQETPHIKSSTVLIACRCNARNRTRSIAGSTARCVTGHAARSITGYATGCVAGYRGRRIRRRQGRKV